MIKLCVLVNDTPYGVMGLRARNLTMPLTDQLKVEILYREAGKLAEFRRFCRTIDTTRPDIVYVMNVGYAGGGAALVSKIRRRIPYILDHGDPSYELLKSSGRPLWESWLVRLAEWRLLRSADAVIARGAFLAEALKKKRLDHVHFIPDGVDLNMFRPLDVSGLRRAHNLDGALTIGIVGSIVWSDKHRMCYGWDILEVIHRLKKYNIKGIIVGDGSGLAHLKKRARVYDIEDRIWFTGRVPHEEVPRYINLMDICVSTQTNDAVGHARTTAKLPEYLACGRFVMATDVGGARNLIRENGFLLPYEGVYDPAHPARMAERLEWILQNRKVLSRGIQGVEMAQKQFEYTGLAEKLSTILKTICGN